MLETPNITVLASLASKNLLLRTISREGLYFEKWVECQTLNRQIVYVVAISLENICSARSYGSEGVNLISTYREFILEILPIGGRSS